MTDSQLIEHLGGSTKLAELLKYEEQGGVQRVQNWKTRGIPAQVKIDYPELFMADVLASRGTSPAADQPTSFPEIHHRKDGALTLGDRETDKA